MKHGTWSCDGISEYMSLSKIDQWAYCKFGYSICAGATMYQKVRCTDVTNQIYLFMAFIPEENYKTTTSILGYVTSYDMNEFKEGMSYGGGSLKQTAPRELIH